VSLYEDPRRFSVELLAPVDNHAVLVRMLANLKGEYARRRNLEGLAAVLRMRVALPGTSLDEGRELVRVLEATGRWAEAVAALEDVERSHPGSDDVVQVERTRLLARMN
jgi:hypothetical protein